MTAGRTRRTAPPWTRICHAFPRLPVVITENRISYTQRKLYQALDSCPNLHLDVSTVWIGRIVEFIAERWGAERLLFGSALPTRDPAVTIGQVAYADLPAADIEAIAGGNLRRLLSWAGPLPEPRSPTPSRWTSCTPSPGTVARSPGRAFAAATATWGATTPPTRRAIRPRQWSRRWTAPAWSQATVFANIGMNGDEIYGNDLVAAAVRRHPGRFIGLTMVNLNRTEAEIEREMERGRQMGMRGVKLHPHLQGVDTNSDKVELACTFANEHHALIVNHDWGTAERMVSLCRKYPDACSSPATRAGRE